MNWVDGRYERNTYRPSVLDYAYRGYRAYRKYSPYVKPAIDLMKRGVKRYRSGKAKTYRKKSYRSSNATKEGLLTTQRDYYVKRKGKKQTKKAIYKRRFVKKVQAAINEHDTSLSLIENINASMVAAKPTTAGGQVVLQSDNTSEGKDLRLGIFGNDASGMRRVLNEIYGKVPDTRTSGNTWTQNIQRNFASMVVIMKSMKCTLAMKNVSGGTLQIDIYECVNKADIDAESYATAYEAWQTLAVEDGVDPANSFTGSIEFARTTKEVAGATPYNVPSFAKYWKILKKTRVNTTDGSLTNYEYYGVKGKYMIGTHMQSTTGKELSKGLVKDILIVVSPTYNDNIGGSPTPALEVQWTKQYFFTCPDYDNERNVIATYNYV